MKKYLNFQIILLFFLCYICGFAFFQNQTKIAKSFFYENKCSVFVENIENNYDILQIKNKYKIKPNELIKSYNKDDLIEYLFDLNFSSEEICQYLFPESKFIYEDLSKKFNDYIGEDNVFVLKNDCKIKIKKHIEKYIDKEQFYLDYLKEQNSKKNFKINLKIIEKNHLNEFKNKYSKLSEFSTQFSSSSNQRKNNIKMALKSIDGKVVENGETFSFNKTTGIRNESTGYKKAKIISGGTFVEGFGGGVCQVSTTLYNAALLAGLDIVEVHQHSLPVSYVEPSFDAMVNTGSSDLVFKNNTGGQIIITSSYKDEVCKICIFGKNNNIKISREYEVFDEIEAEKEVVDEDYEKYNLEIEVGEEKRLSYSKNGFFSKGYLVYYDSNGNVVEKKLIRKNKYNPTKGVIVKRTK